MDTGQTGTLSATPPSGLSGQEAAERAERGLANVTDSGAGRSFAQIVRANVFTLFNAIIGVLFVIMLIVGPIQDALFGLVIFINTGVGVVQEWRAKRTLDRLAVVGEAPVRVQRDGSPVDLPKEQVVLGDLVLLGGGDKIVVDGAVTGARGLEVDESALTGEADPIAKNPGDTVSSGSFVVSGSGAFTATAVGPDAYAAKLVAQASAFSLAHSELLSGINRFLRYITWIIIPTAVLLVVSQYLANPSIRQAISSSVAGIVPMVPEGLVLLTSVAFALGAIRLARRKCLIQEMPAIEILARVDTLCLDKTGTLTEPGMDLEEIVTLAEAAPVVPALNALATTEERPNATLLAVAEGLRARGDGDDPGWPLTGSVPFSSARKWSGAAFDGQGAWVLGAPDVLLPAESPVRTTADERASLGLRVLVLGRVTTLDDPGDIGRVEPAALLVLRQRVRPEARATLDYFAEQNVSVKVISGDNAASVGAVAASLGIPGADHPVDARTLPDDPAALGDALDGNSVFGRVTPEQKRTFVGALQKRGHTVAMTGDGVNDVLALKDADLGVAMGSGAPATRAVAQVVLLDNSFGTLPHVVAEGRRVLGNIERVSNLFLTKTCYSVILAVLFGVLQLQLPFLPRHITLIGAVTIGIPAFFLALAPNLERARPGFIARVLRFAIPSGIACGAATITAYYVGRALAAQPGLDPGTATLTLFTLVHIGLIVLLLIVRPYTWWRVGLVIVMGAAFWLVVSVPFTRHFFAIHSDQLRDGLLGVAIALVYGVLLTVGTMVYRRRASATS
ncbi:MAG TPA: HAD-IC family P-type ATPase [Streptosporangiaceae bacterium]